MYCASRSISGHTCAAMRRLRWIEIQSAPNHATCARDPASAIQLRLETQSHKRETTALAPHDQLLAHFAVSSRPLFASVLSLQALPCILLFGSLLFLCGGYPRLYRIHGTRCERTHSALPQRWSAKAISDLAFTVGCIRGGLTTDSPAYDRFIQLPPHKYFCKSIRTLCYILSVITFLETAIRAAPSSKG